jgi:hypothetical protein
MLAWPLIMVAFTRRCYRRETVVFYDVPLFIGWVIGTAGFLGFFVLRKVVQGFADNYDCGTYVQNWTRFSWLLLAAGALSACGAGLVCFEVVRSSLRRRSRSARG